MRVSCSSFQALYSYVPQNEDELELKEGDLVSVMEKCDDGWFVGMCHRPQETFPGGAVTLAVSHLSILGFCRVTVKDCLHVCNVVPSF